MTDHSWCRTCGTPEPDDPCFDCGEVSPTHADQRESAALRFPPPPPEFRAALSGPPEEEKS